MTRIDWENITNYIDSVGTTDTVFPFAKTQSSVKVTTSGANDNIIYTIGGQSGTLSPGQNVTVTGTISSMTLRSASGRQPFQVWATEAGTEKDETDTSYQGQIDGLTTQLAQKVQQTDFNNALVLKADKTTTDTLQSQVLGLASGAPKGVYATLSALQTAYPTGNTNIYLVTADGKWYFWSGSAWTAGGTYQSTGLADNSVTASKLSLIDLGTYSLQYYDPIVSIEEFVKFISPDGIGSGKSCNIILHGSIWLNLPGKYALWFVTSSGCNVPMNYGSFDGTSVFTFNLAHGSYLVYNSKTNSIECRANTAALTTGDILLANCHNGEVKGGIFKQIFNSLYVTKMCPNGVIPTVSDTSYITTMLDGVNAKASDLINSDRLTFGLITDTHYSATNGSSISKNHITNICNYSKYKNLDFIVHGGDVVNGYAAITDTKKDISTMVQYSADSKVPFYFIKGNHDDNTQYARSTKLLSDIVTPQDWYSRVVKSFEKDVVLDSANPTGGYFYKDFQLQKVRAVFINTNDTPLTTNYDTNTLYAISNAQLNWIANKALNFSDKGMDKSNWAVVMIGHIPPKASLSFPGDVQVWCGLQLEGILQTFKTGGQYVAADSSIVGFEYSVNVDYSSQGPMELIGYFFGHTHYDFTIVDNGITYITSISSLEVKANGVADGANCPTRTVGTTSEDSWNIFTIDRANRKIYGTKFGAGLDRVISY